MNPKEVVTTPQACQMLKVTRQTLYMWMEKGKLKPWMKVGGASWLFLRREVLKAKDLRYRRN